MRLSFIEPMGANGAGKATALKAISGLFRTEVGKVGHGGIRFNGQRIDRISDTEVISDSE